MDTFAIVTGSNIKDPTCLSCGQPTDQEGLRLRGVADDGKLIPICSECARDKTDLDTLIDWMEAGRAITAMLELGRSDTHSFTFVMSCETAPDSDGEYKHNLIANVFETGAQFLVRTDYIGKGLMEIMRSFTAKS